MNRRSLMISGGATLALAACSKPAAPKSGEMPKVINFSVLAAENANSLEILWKPVLADMEKSVGIPVKAFYASNYTALIEAMRFKQTDVGWFSNFSGLEAVRRAGGEVFARTFDPSGTDGYTSLIIAPAASKTTLEDLLKCDKKLDFGMGDAKSTSGSLAPKTYLFSPHGIDPEKCFKTVRSANHQANLFSVANGVLDAATGNSTSLRLEKERNPGLIKKVRILWTSPPLPEDPMIWRKDLDPAVKEKVRQFFITYGQSQDETGRKQREILKLISIGGFKPADDSHLITVREMEANENWEEAKRTGDKAKIEATQKALDAVRAERTAMQAKLGQLAPVSAPVN
jgi:phosphonate transport system substrate-binding protein